MIDRRLFTNFDWTLFLLVLVIAALGVLNIYSAAYTYVPSGTPYFLRQIYWIIVGLGIIVTICSIDYHIFEDTAYWLYAIMVLLLVVVLVAGRTSMGATRWLHLGFINIQPSELMKIVIIMTLARYFVDYAPAEGLSVRDLGYPLLLVGMPALLIMKQPDLGTAVLVVMIAAAMLLYVGVRWKTLAVVVLATGPSVWLAWSFYLRDYQKNRVLNFISPERDPLGSGYHIIQSKIAVGSGGVLGKGFLMGTQSHLRFLPEQHTDFAFSVFAEEWGFLGCLVMIGLYLVLVLWGLGIAGRCNDRFGALLSVGVSAMLFWHIVVNIGMVIGVFPVVGVPLPLFSYGGTSMITTMTGVGILLNVSMRRFMF